MNQKIAGIRERLCRNVNEILADSHVWQVEEVEFTSPSQNVAHYKHQS